MTADLTPKAADDCLGVLAEAAAGYRQQGKQLPDTGVMVDALLLAEKTAKQQRLSYPFACLQGQWRLCFATGTRKVRKRGGIVLGKGFYVPKFAKAQIFFSTACEQALNRGEIGNQVQLGAVLLKLIGPAQYLGKKNLLAFDFTQMQISLFGRVIYNGQFRGGQAKTEEFYNQAIAKLPFFAFFLVTQDLIASRGRGGGLALWIRD
jgi:hypothetical protein